MFQIMESFMKRVGLSVEELDRLNVIHVTGTKGKGSTCAYTEQILRNYGFRTGFYSSPHLVDIRERIRINGQLIDKDVFDKNFRLVYRRLHETKEAHDGAMPTYFVFFTLVVFRVFLEEKVDVAVVEVGIGGQYDCTNIIRRPWVCGITSLGIDHIKILGDTIEKIAWHKGGIFKMGVPAFTVKQPDTALAVLKERAEEINCPLWVCPDLEDYQTDCGPLRLSLAGEHQCSNASLALQLSHAWLQRRSLAGQNVPNTPLKNTGTPQANPFRPSPSMVKGLEETVWPGRTQVLKHGDITYFLDGAHTVRSIQACVRWFTESSAQHEENTSGPVTRVLLFNLSGGRDSAAMLKLLVPCRFNLAVFCPNIPDASTFCQADLWNVNNTVEDMMAFCLEHEKNWRLFNNLQDINGTHQHTLVFPCIRSALWWITQGRDSALTDSADTVLVTPSTEAKAAPLCDAAQIHILVTGSLFLVGGTLKNLHSESYK
ncbi:folylpolyglutamate synthase, mitochondrial-like [Cheilinus undulatus]|uniref:folylpolyglutamate synthase, mitochondrial-like n=1 Tax=Cheilinus undulatus TaxID=241271 RepID=UPI001BD504D5|nr:folylpolyglutamate synthase, mitochondrial-like [Cheilinus undulatus]